MRTILFILQKEFLQILRDKTILPMILVVPIIQLLILVHAATFEIRNIPMVVVDKDMSQTSQKLISKFEGSPFFIVKSTTFSINDAMSMITKDKAVFILQIPQNFEKGLMREKKGKLLISINAINGMVAGLSNAYANSIIADFNRGIISDFVTIPSKQITNIKQADISYSFWFNPDLNYKNFMVPGILALIITIISVLLSAMNIVKEKEMGTIEQINVTPIKKYQLISGKLIPLIFIGIFDFAFGIFIGRLLFHIPLNGSLWLVFGMATEYLLVGIGMGFLISTLVNAQQQAMFISYFFLIVFIMMSGLFTSVESMPVWAQYFNRINPVAYIIKALRMILLKGSTFENLLTEFYSLLVLGILSLSVAIWRYRKVV